MTINKSNSVRFFVGYYKYIYNNNNNNLELAILILPLSLMWTTPYLKLNRLRKPENISLNVSTEESYSIKSGPVMIGLI